MLTEIPDARPGIVREIERLKVAETAPHYNFVRTLTVLAAGLLGLSVSRGSNALSSSLVSERLSQLALISLALSVIGGVVALYGEPGVWRRAYHRLEGLMKKHNSNHIAATIEAGEHTLVLPHPIHRHAFHASWICFVLGLLLLVGSTFPRLHNPPTNTRPPTATAPPEDQTKH